MMPTASARRHDNSQRSRSRPPSARRPRRKSARRRRARRWSPATDWQAPRPRPPPSSPASTKVLVADAPALRAHAGRADRGADRVAGAGLYEAILAPATTSGKNIMPRVAALLDVMQISEISKVVAPDTFVRPIYAGNAIQTVRSTDAKKVITVRTAAFQATGEGGARRRSSRPRPRPIPAFPASSARNCRNPSGRS